MNLLQPTTSEADAEVTELRKYADTGRMLRIGVWVLLLGFGGFIAWASFAPLEQGVPAAGTVSVDTKRKAVQHLYGGIVAEVFVREGQEVATGEPLMRLDDNAQRADLEAVRQQVFGLRVLEARLLAELAGYSKIEFEQDLLQAGAADPQILRQMNNEGRLLESRQRSLNAQITGLRETIKSHEAMIISTQNIRENLAAQAISIEKELVGVRTMVREGYLPQVTQLEKERQIAAIRSQTSDNAALEIRAQQSILGLKQQVIAVQADNDKELEQSLAQVRPELHALTERLRALNETQSRLIIRSPSNGRIVGLSVQTVGSVITPGQLLMEVVPRDELLTIEARVGPQFIDRLAEGDLVDIRFNAFANTPQLVVPGILMSLSADTVADKSGNGRDAPYYLARITLSPDATGILGDRKLQPGMSVEVVFKTGTRTLLQYIVHPLTKRIAASLKEE
jgi:protease secretion system membrane fusion protein